MYFCILWVFLADEHIFHIHVGAKHLVEYFLCVLAIRNIRNIFSKRFLLYFIGIWHCYTDIDRDGHEISRFGGLPWELCFPKGLYLTVLRAFYYDVLLLTNAYSAYPVHFFLGQFPNMEFMLLLLLPLFLTELLYFPGQYNASVNITLFLTGCLCALNYMSKLDYLINYNQISND